MTSSANHFAVLVDAGCKRRDRFGVDARSGRGIDQIGADARKQGFAIRVRSKKHDQDFAGHSFSGQVAALAIGKFKKRRDVDHFSSPVACGTSTVGGSVDSVAAHGGGIDGVSA